MSITEAQLAEINVRTYIAVQNAFDECDPEIKEVVSEMLDICRSGETSEDEKSRALHTVVEALFPMWAADALDGLNRHMSNEPNVVAEKERLDQEEQLFADSLRKLLSSKKMSQKRLAELVGVGQPAISNMLNRQCRPQRKTIKRIADALSVKPADLWPSFDDKE